MTTDRFLPFFTNPFWRQFVGRHVLVVSLSEPEHRLRDARALMAIRSFLPPEESGLTTCLTVTVGGSTPPHWPQEIAKSPGVAVVVLGRPALFGKEATAFLRECEPRCLYDFENNDDPKPSSQLPNSVADPRRRAFRSVIGHLDRMHHWPGQLFDDQRGADPSPDQLSDLGIVYSGYHGTRPVVVLAGSSTVSTWGCAVWATQMRDCTDLRWWGEVQGVIKCRVSNTTGQAYQSVAASVHENQLLAPAHFWMEGADLPPPNGWREAVRRRGKSKVRLKVLVNGHRIFSEAEDYLTPLVLLAWLNSKARRELASGIVRATCSSPEVLEWIDQFLGKRHALGPRTTIQPRVTRILNDAARYICERGGLATVEPRTDRITRFTLWFRDPPGFFPVSRV